MQKQLSWVFLAQGFSYSFSQDVGQDCSRKALIRVEDLL